jgi:GNAT superfamily N-acetyltransferase
VVNVDVAERREDRQPIWPSQWSSQLVIASTSQPAYRRAADGSMAAPGHSLPPMVTIERIGPDGFERVRAVRLRALRDAPDAFWVTADEEAATTDEEWRERLARADAATFVATRDGRDIGLAVGARHHIHPADAGLYAMWVAPEARGEGAGLALVRAVTEWAHGAGFATLRLDVGDANEPAVRLYARAGFVPTGVVGALPPPRAHITEHERALDLRGKVPDEPTPSE